MAITITALKDTVSQVLTDIRGKITDSQPFLSNSFLRAIGTGIAGRKYDSDKMIYQVAKGRFPQTAEDDDLEYCGDIFDITRNPSTKASGYIVVIGTSGNTVESGSSFSKSTATYTTTSDGTIGPHAVSVTLVGSGTTVTATADSDHQFATGTTITISGASASEYNGSFVITATSSTVFTYETTTVTVTNPTGTITASSVQAYIPVVSSDFGEDQNAESGEELTINTAVTGVNDTAYVSFSGISGGTDSETDSDFRERVIEAWQNSVSNFNDYAIKKYIKDNVSGVTRVWVQDITPYVGAVTVYFVRDNDDDIFPTPSAVEQTKNTLLEIKPAHMIDSDVVVSAPTKLSVDFTFSSITPNTTEIKEAVQNSLTAFFEDYADVGTDISDKAYISAIYNSVGSDTGAQVTDFTLTAPSGDITVADGELAALGTIAYV